MLSLHTLCVCGTKPGACVPNSLEFSEIGLEDDRTSTVDFSPPLDEEIALPILDEPSLLEPVSRGYLASKAERKQLVEFNGCERLHCFDHTVTANPIRESRLGEYDYTLNAIISAGDVLSIRGDDNTNAITHIGAAGGFLGHVLVVVSEPVPIWAGSVESLRYEEIWPDCVDCVWSVSIIESCSVELGLHESELLLYISSSRKLFTFGEDPGDEVVGFEDWQQVHVWHPPPQLRACDFQFDYMHAVLNDMRASQKNWSWSTAVRAFLRAGGLSQQAERPITMKEVKEAWHVEPICTSIVIRFWQQYLEKIALHISIDPLNLILKFMPLRADRVLPGELFITMLACGWCTWEKVPVQSILVFEPLVSLVHSEEHAEEQLIQSMMKRADIADI